MKNPYHTENIKHSRDERECKKHKTDARKWNEILDNSFFHLLLPSSVLRSFPGDITLGASTPHFIKPFFSYPINITCSSLLSDYFIIPTLMVAKATDINAMIIVIY